MNYKGMEKSYIISSSQHLALQVWLNEEHWDAWGVFYVWEKQQAHVEFWFENFIETDSLIEQVTGEDTVNPYLSDVIGAQT